MIIPRAFCGNSCTSLYHEGHNAKIPFFEGVCAVSLLQQRPSYLRDWRVGGIASQHQRDGADQRHLARQRLGEAHQRRLRHRHDQPQRAELTVVRESAVAGWLVELGGATITITASSKVIATTNVNFIGLTLDYVNICNRIANHSVIGNCTGATGLRLTPKLADLSSMAAPLSRPATRNHGETDASTEPGNFSAFVLSGAVFGDLVKLNGAPLTLLKDGLLPHPAGVAVAGGTLELPAASIEFLEMSGESSCVKLRQIYLYL